jgi:antitoxin component of MazEF toxin-antitoxin module
MIFKTKFKKIGDSLCIIFPRKFLKKENLKISDGVYLLGIEKTKNE